jgi:hypothetical protein
LQYSSQQLLTLNCSAILLIISCLERFSTRKDFAFIMCSNTLLSFSDNLSDYWLLFVRMGSNFTKIDSDFAKMLCPADYDDINQVGTVYFVQHKSKSDATPTEAFRAPHYGLAVDFTGNFI